MRSNRPDVALPRDPSFPRPAQLAAALLAAALVAGCASVRVDRFVRTGAEPKPAEQVEVLESLPASAYLAIARIEVRDRGLGREARRLREKLVAEAARLGADAVVLERPATRRSVGGSPYPIGLYDDLLVAGTAIVYRPAATGGDA